MLQKRFHIDRRWWKSHLRRRLPYSRFAPKEYPFRTWLSLAALLLIFGAALPRAHFALQSGAASLAAPSDEYRQARQRFVHEEIESRGIRDARVLAAMRKVPRHLFVPPDQQKSAYFDSPLFIGYRQTISEPYLVAFMTEALELKPHDRVLEIGTGSGYQAAILAEIVQEVYTIEIVEPLAKSAEERLNRLGYSNVHVRAGDGYRGWPEVAPFDAIILTAAPPQRVPPPLIEQLREGGRLVAPVGGSEQDLIRVRRTATGTTEEVLLPVRFVPMTGEAQEPEAQSPN
jgi:protein-L-isoaspartate(D-aspartate) O-methyltransferase